MPKNGKSCEWKIMQMARHICMILLCHLYDFPFLGMICRGLYNFYLLACFQWNLFGRLILKIWISLAYFYFIFGCASNDGNCTF
jgi:hypothetical protein